MLSRQDRIRPNLTTILFGLFLFFLPLEQILNYLLGLDTLMKPYRIFLIVYLILISRTAYQSINKHIVLFGCILTYGLIMASLNLAFGSGNSNYLINGLIHFVFGLMIMMSLPSALDKSNAFTLFNIYILGVVVSIVFGYYDFFRSETFRMRGFFNNPNHLAFYINFASLGLVYKILRKNRAGMNIIIFLFFSVTIIFTGSRTGMLLQAIIILYVLYNLPIKVSMLILSTLGLIVVYNISKFELVDLNVLNRYDIENLKSASGRNDIRDAAIRLGIDTFFLGVGIQQYRYYHLSYLKDNSYSILSDFELGTHNHFLDLLVNFGVPGLAMFLFFMVKIILFSFQLSGLGRSFYRLTVAVVVLASMSQDMFIFPLFWLLIGLLSNAQKIIRNA